VNILNKNTKESNSFCMNWTHVRFGSIYHESESVLIPDKSFDVKEGRSIFFKYLIFEKIHFNFHLTHYLLTLDK